MAYTEKVVLSGSALSFLLYECINSGQGQEGFFVGGITSEITNHISDSDNDNARLDTQIAITTVLPLPAESLFYNSTGKINEEWLKQFLSTTADDVVGWYKFREFMNIRPTFRDKLIAKDLQKYFAKYHNKKTFVSCNLSNRSTLFGSTHTYVYRFGKINSLDMYEYIENVMGNLGEKLSGYKKPLHNSTQGVFNEVVEESNIQNDITGNAILRIQKAVNDRLEQEAQIATQNEIKIKELEEVIRKITKILCERQSRELLAAYKDIIELEKLDTDLEMANECVAAMNVPLSCESEGALHMSDGVSHNNPLPVTLNYAAALKYNAPSTSKSVNSKLEKMEEDLINFDDDKNDKKTSVKTTSDPDKNNY